jgi:acetylornithine deacetylase/succinyl-diaminopimelate desuccinylase-like protein
VPAEQVRAYAASRFDATVGRLSEYLTFPAVSCDPGHRDQVIALARRVAADLEALGFTSVEVLSLEKAVDAGKQAVEPLPMVVGSWMGAGPQAPTLLIYGHLDLLPVKGEVEKGEWRTDPHVATRVGDRLYARGAADDMGGWVSHLAAIEAWLHTHGKLPCNVKLIIEGEEEIGSPNLERYMMAYPERFEADVMVLTDCENPSTEIPGLTVSLRGLIELELTVEALSSDGHSGLWGNMVPDVSIALLKLIDRLTDADGRLTLGRVEVDEAWRESVRDLPLNDAVIRSGAHIIDEVSPLPLRGRPAAEWLWRQPAVTVVATTLPTPSHKKNALRTRASAILSVRLAPGQGVPDTLARFEAALLPDPPAGVKVSLKHSSGEGGAWLYSPKGPAFEAADRAYRAAWGHGLVEVGVGGSIPFVALFGRRYGSLPLILNGVMDPLTTAHGPNESLHLGVFEKAIAANVYLYAELGQLGKAGLQG